jgi:hypothetical protein
MAMVATEQSNKGYIKGPPLIRKSISSFFSGNICPVSVILGYQAGIKKAEEYEKDFQNHSETSVKSKVAARIVPTGSPPEKPKTDVGKKRAAPSAAPSFCGE